MNAGVSADKWLAPSGSLREAVFIAALVLNCYILPMNAVRPILHIAFVLRDHDRLPGRFFGRMTASIQAGL
ncbi:hypothetical protein CAK95_07660 [Pseudorhodoplanes sinuspersici]|uniref:Uncharacterized protein n=1 Tax=Pseudorhodoplanes sinuspersici TaxID=1235591 RepID=A0A1W6ZPB8_9HYPH|nr:hypothetical protein CAK95_07660 [Pseudorhodoplanes sinuspersici]